MVDKSVVVFAAFVSSETLEALVFVPVAVKAVLALMNISVAFFWLILRLLDSLVVVVDVVEL